jgi:hypothetical protein
VADQFDGLEDQGNFTPGSTASDDVARENLLTLAQSDPEGCARRLLADWDASNKHVKSLKAQWKVNRARAKGFTGVSLIKQQDENKAYIPIGARQSVAGMNKAARLKRRLRAQMFADPAKPEATPSTDEDQDRDAAELATRVLEDLCSEGNLDFNLKAGDAFDLGSDYGSGFIRFWVDPYGGGNKPKDIYASPFAVTEQEPFALGPAGEKAPPRLRYVTVKGQIVDDPKQAARVWLPKLRDELLTGRQVRFLPHTARDLWDADAVMVGAMVPLGVVKAMFPELAKKPDVEIQKLTGYRPQESADLLPSGKKDHRGSGDVDAQYVFVLSRYHKQCADYPQGAYLVLVGESYLAHTGEWYDTEADQPLDIPLTQFGHYHEEDNPYKQGTMELLGPGNEVRAMMLGAMLEHLDKFLNRRIFVPLTSVLKPEQLQSETASVIQINPGGEPFYEQLPDFPVSAEKMYAMTGDDMDDESGLQESGQGGEVPSVTSGKQLTQIIEQVVAGLSELRENTIRGFVRGWRIMLQLTRAYYSMPQKIKWMGEDGGYKVKEWTGSDLGGTRDVRMLKGSFTQLTPVHKANLALTYFGVRDAQGQPLLGLQDVRHLITGEVGPWLGMRDDPHRMRVKRQISQWSEGPPEGWQPPQAPTDPFTGQPAVDPNTGQPAQPPPDPTLTSIFAPVPVDEEQAVAVIRTEELGRAMAGGRYARMPPPWQAGLQMAYQTARQAAGQATVREQQQAAQAQQQQAVQVEKEKEAAKVEGKIAVERAVTQMGGMGGGMMSKPGDGRPVMGGMTR